MSTPPQSSGSLPALAADGHREPVLDGVRGLAVLLVLFHHLVYSSGIDRRFWPDLQLFRLASSSWLGVDLFFVLSGFLITGILYQAKGSPFFFRSFYGRRVLRIFPLYYGFLVFALVAFPLWLPTESARNLLDHQLWYWLYLSNVYVAREGWQDPSHLGHLWSLAVEEQFYLLWPLAVWALNRKWLIRLSLTCFFGALALRLIKPFGMDELAAYVLLATRMDSLAAGAFLALVIRGDRGAAVLGWWPQVVAAVSFTVVAALYYRHGWLNFEEPLVAVVGYTFVAMGFAALIAMAIMASAGARLRRALSAMPLAFLGKYSYGLYVVHVPIILFLQDAGLRATQFPRLFGSSLPGVVVFSAVGAGLSLAVAVAIYHAWEAPFLRLKRHLPYRPQAPREAHGNVTVAS
jgi:peptidoglycan/LPS O-acetylase OafA/YrhL